jgi:hypothetical protein
MNLAPTTSCFTRTCYQFIKEIQNRASYCININSLTVQSMYSTSLIIISYIFMKITDKILSLKFVTRNCSISYTRNGLAPKYWQILRGIQQKIVRFTKLINNFDNIDDLNEKTYSFKFNYPSFREFGNIYNGNDMTPFCYYPIVII